MRLWVRARVRARLLGVGVDVSGVVAVGVCRFLLRVARVLLLWVLPASLPRCMCLAGSGLRGRSGRARLRP